MKKLKIVADKNIPFLKGVAEYYGEVAYLGGAEFSSEAVKDADVLIIRTVRKMDEELLAGSSVKLICTATIGYDHIDTEYCDKNGIIWKNAPGCNSSSVQQFVASSLISIARKKGFLLKGKTIGVVGVGNVGAKVASVCENLGMRVLLNDPPRERAEGNGKFVSLDYIKEHADIITFHTPLTKSGEDKTYHLADESFFKSLPQNPIIINSARGGIVETSAIKSAILQGLISGAIIDCWENEPNIDLEYLNMVDQGTPHIAGYSADGKANATRMSLERIAELFDLSKEPIASVKAPDPQNPVIDLSEFSSENRIEEAILRTYEPSFDRESLLHNPDKFSKQRADYPMRREYPSYRVLNATPEEAEVLARLGFILD